MATRLSGPMFESSKTKYWESSFNKEGGHYNIFHGIKEYTMDAIREFFPDGEANELNFILFSTSGVHGTYNTIEEAEEYLKTPPKDNDELFGEVTFLIVQPRIVCLRYGNVEPKSLDDIEFLKKLRQSSWDIIQTIGIDND